MVDNICSRWEALKEIRFGGQLSLFAENYDNNMNTSPMPSKKILLGYLHFAKFII